MSTTATSVHRFMFAQDVTEQPIHFFRFEELIMLIAETRAKLRRSLVAHEGVRKFPYIDTLGNITIGIGYNLSDRGIDEDWINQQYESDVRYFHERLSEDFPWFRELNQDRQVVLIDMAFMGYKHFLSFKRMLKALRDEDYNQAALEMLNSKWAIQVKGRANDLAHAMATGVYNR